MANRYFEVFTCGGEQYEIHRSRFGGQAVYDLIHRLSGRLLCRGSLRSCLDFRTQLFQNAAAADWGWNDCITT